MIFGTFLGAGLLIGTVVVPDIRLPSAARYGLAATTLLPALALLGSALRLFSRSRTRPEPWRPTTAVIVTGVYRFTRNPMYLGMVLAYAGVAVLLDSLPALLLLPVAVATIHQGVILREERYLAAKFGETYLAYQARVRRWL